MFRSFFYARFDCRFLVGAHPRSRGENVAVLLHDRAVVGLIPTHAGTTYPSQRARPAASAHPHSRGEYRGYCRTSGNSAGSSPLMRGKRDAGQRGDRPCRLIPAHAGKTGQGGRRPLRCAAHPRSCEENVDDGDQSIPRTGSSPLMRGKLDPQRDQHDAHGLIPAHAGKTPSFMASAKGWRAHPRSHGENVENGCPIFHDPGSSPLTRGKQRLQELRLERLWLIPAHAGKTTMRLG